MPNNTDPAREAAFELAALEYRNELGLVVLTSEVNRAHREGFYAGYDAGAAREEWVAVSERLPHKAGDYLVTHVNGFVQEIEWRVEPRRGGRWITEFGDLSVTAWMPKPQPYGGKDE